MDINLYQKERVQNMAIYFLQHTNKVNIAKLIKLFYFCDRQSYIDTGFTMSGIEYVAQETGPVSDSLQKDIEGSNNVFGVSKTLKSENNIFKTNLNFEKKYFSTYEIKVLDAICKQYKDATEQKMSDDSHKEELPWYKAWQDGKGKNSPIDFNADSAIDEDKQEMINYAQNCAKTFRQAMALL